MVSLVAPIPGTGPGPGQTFGVGMCGGRKGRTDKGDEEGEKKGKDAGRKEGGEWNFSAFIHSFSSHARDCTRHGGPEETSDGVRTPGFSPGFTMALGECLSFSLSHWFKEVVARGSSSSDLMRERRVHTQPLGPNRSPNHLPSHPFYRTEAWVSMLLDNELAGLLPSPPLSYLPRGPRSKGIITRESKTKHLSSILCDRGELHIWAAAGGTKALVLESSSSPCHPGSGSPQQWQLSMEGMGLENLTRECQTPSLRTCPRPRSPTGLLFKSLKRFRTLVPDEMWFLSKMSQHQVSEAGWSPGLPNSAASSNGLLPKASTSAEETVASPRPA